MQTLKMLALFMSDLHPFGSSHHPESTDTVLESLQLPELTDANLLCQVPDIIYFSVVFNSCVAVNLILNTIRIAL